MTFNSIQGEMNSTSSVFENQKCSDVLATFLLNNNNVSPPMFFHVGNQNLTFTIHDFLQDDGKNCNFLFSFINVNATGPLQFNLQDMLLIGMQYFNKFTGLHFNFETSELSFVASSKDVIQPSPIGKGVSGTLVIVGIILGVCILVGAIAGIMVWRRKKLASRLDAYDEL